MEIVLEHHSDVCFSVVNKRKRCKSCVKEYERLKKTEQRKKNSEKQINTRTLSNKGKQKYDHVICDKCKRKILKICVNHV